MACVSVPKATTQQHWQSHSAKLALSVALPRGAVRWVKLKREGEAEDTEFNCNFLIALQTSDGCAVCARARGAQRAGEDRQDQEQ